MKPLIISFSGGRTSAYMTVKLLDKYSGKRDIHVVFANTGKERIETIDFVRNCDTFFNFNSTWIESVTNQEHGVGVDFRIVDWLNYSENGEPFEDYISKHGIPNKAKPDCSRELKAYPIIKFIKSLGIKDYELAIGIRFDESNRCLENPGKIIYPLIKEFPTNKLMIIKWWKKQKFDLQLKGYEGNCDLCWKKSKRKLLTIIYEHPEFVDWWSDIEIKYGNFVPESRKNNNKLKLPIVFYRESESALELLEDSKGKFKLSKDDFSENELRKDLFDDFMQQNSEMDYEGSCGKSSCEVFNKEDESLLNELFYT